MCEYDQAFDLIHHWLHVAARVCDRKMELEVLELERKILDVVNREDVENEIKLLALFAVLETGALQIEATTKREPEPEEGSPTIH